MPQEYETEVEELNPNKKVFFDLFAVSNHFGSLGGGHYTAFAKNSIKNKWYCFDDSSVTEVNNEKDIISSAAYVLFYRRRKMWWPKIKKNIYIHISIFYIKKRFYF